jgi:hypothetical protein
MTGRLILFSEEDEEEEDDQAVEKAEGDETAGNESTERPAKKRKGTESMDLVEFSPDELRSVDRELLNAEITQLEGVCWSFPLDLHYNLISAQRIPLEPNPTSTCWPSTGDVRPSS